MNTITTYLIAIGGIVSLMLIWVWVQNRWRETFAENITDSDVLAERRSCRNCGCIKVCKKESSQIQEHKR